MSQKRPNIIMIMTDQLIPMMTGPYGNSVAVTPNMDRLAENGILFENAYTTCPVCVPARYSLLTGQYLSSHKAYDNGAILSSDIPTHNHYLNIAGYDTVLAGKAHFIGPDQLHGFNKRLMTNVYPANFKFMPQRNANANFSDLHPNPIAVDYLGENVGVRQWSMELDYDEEAIFHAVKYLAGKCTEPAGSAQEPLPEQDERPFLLQVSLNHPHEPFHVLKKFWDLYEGVDIPIPQYPKNMEATYTSMDKTLIKLHGSEQVDVKNSDSLKKLHKAYLAAVSYVDSKIGTIIDTLDNFGLTDDTIIIFCSDHGDMLGHKGMVQKRVFYDYSTRINMLFQFPRNFPHGKPGTRCMDPVSITDIAPTLLEIAGITDHLPMDGQSLIPQINGQTNPERYVFCENYSEGVTSACFMVRKGSFKYTYIYKGETQLFNMEEDPEEWNNLSGRSDYKEIEEKMRQLILKHFDPEKIDREAQESFERRRIIDRSIAKTGLPKWNYRPIQDIDNLYWQNK